MNKSTCYLSFAFAALLFFGCGRSMNEERAPMYDQSAPITMADSVSVAGNMEEKGYFKNKQGALKESEASNGFISSSAAVANKDTSRKFVRTADMRFRVQNVRSSNYNIEDVIAGFDGFVIYTNLYSTIDYKRITSISADSSLETIYYTVINDMTLRVPNTNLDTALKVIAKQIDYLDYRIIKADDVSLSLLSNRLKQQRLKMYDSRMVKAIDEQGKKLNQTSGAEENILDKQMASDDTKIANLKIEDEIAYSTIKLNIYQRQTIRRELIENDKNIEGYKPGFLHQVKEAISSGWSALEKVIVFLFNIWPLLLLLAIVWFGYRRFFQTKK